MADLSATVVVRFEGGLEQVPAEELVAVPSLDATLSEEDLGSPVDAVVRALALAIASVNDQWGVFSRSRVRLLPHQLWVCRTVNRKWPFRWLVADDVGLGKTIECGLVLMPLIASGRVRRLLILAPAKLVPQWQFRLKDMFDIRLQRYHTQADTAYGDFWGTAFQVAASFHTLRREGAARERLLESEPWDIVVVDEAHHLGIDQRASPTLAYSLVADLESRGKINSLLFFTGTPHRGKDFGFFGLMHLVRPDLFDPEKDSAGQLARLPLAMIRNNKEAVTDLQGNRLFQPVTVNNREYAYSEEEALFYRTLSEFIIDGRAYAATLDGRAQTARMLVLTILQKLAASSIAAIRQALRRRRAMLKEVVEEAGRRERAAAVNLPDDEQATLDEVAEAEEELPGAAAIVLMQDEIGRLGDLITLSENVAVETKVERLVALIGEELPAGEPVLLFTEYKATQALIVNTLHSRYGHGTAAFINGDDRLDGLVAPSGEIGSVGQAREGAADAFNAGRVRFLVSTEAGGEGIDLQERCAVLVHADMPWNPMRLHQRVGRLSRYGQQRPVSVYILRNPETVEARIWDLLNEKLERVQHALNRVMDQPEDISQLVIGMAGSALFNRLYSGAEGMTGERLAGWFDQATATLGGQDVVDTVRDMLGSVARFDFQQVGRDLPRVDVPDLERFFRLAVGRHGRRVFKHDDGLEIRAPEAWRRHYFVRDRYKGLVFDRGLRGVGAAARVLGVGHKLFDVALGEARDLPVRVAALDGLVASTLVLAVEDEVTDTGAVVRRLIFGVTDGVDGPAPMRDWELLRLLNGVKVRASEADAEPGTSADEMKAMVDRLKRAFDSRLADHAPAFRRPTSWPEMLLIPRTDAIGGR